MISTLALTLALLATAPDAAEVRGPLVPRLALAFDAPAADLRLPEPGIRDVGGPAPARPASMLRSSAGFLLGDALAAGIVGVGWALASRETGGAGMEAGFILLPFAVTGAALAVTAPPLYGTLLGAHGERAPGTAAALLAGGALHLAALLGAISLVEHDQRWAAAGLLLAVDVGVAPWAVTRVIDATRERAAARDAIDRAHPVADAAGPAR